MIVLVIRTPFLEGAGDGIEFYIGKFEAEKLSDLTVWATAVSYLHSRRNGDTLQHRPKLSPLFHTYIMIRFLFS